MEKVAEVLAGLREERRRLVVELSGVDRAIAALEEVLGIEPAPEERLAVTTPAPSVPEEQAAPAPGPYAMSGLYAAVAAYLTDAGEPKTAREIAEALQAGGYPTRAANFTATVRTMLQRPFSVAPYGIHASETGRHWFVRT
jgi:hypothetical protein